MSDADAVVIGSGPNGLVAAALLARAGWSVTVLERSAVAGGAVSSAALTLPGYVHDPCAAFFGLLHACPPFRALGLDRRVSWAGFEVVQAALVGPAEGALCHPDPERTARAMAAAAPADGPSWLALWRWWERQGRALLGAMVAPVPSLRPGLRLLRAAGVGGTLRTARALLEPMEALAGRLLAGAGARALLASGVTHTDLAVDQAGSVPQALVLAMVGQDRGMPVPVGGAGRLAQALEAAVREAGGVVQTGRPVVRVAVERGRAVGVVTADGERVRARGAVLADVGALALVRDLVGEERFPRAFVAEIARCRAGSGVFKLDLALDGPVPWLLEGLERCGVVHLTGGLETMARSAFEVRRGLLPARPLLVVGQQSVADPTRAPAGCHTLWVEMQAPSAPRGDAAGAIAAGSWETARPPFAERAIDLLEEHAPGLRERVVGVAVRAPTDIAADNPNLVGGDVNAGTSALDQQGPFRPAAGWARGALPVRGLYLCSAAAHPGGGVHGMVGWNCARRVLRDARRRV